MGTVSPKKKHSPPNSDLNGVMQQGQVNVTAHPSSDWALQQLREAIPGDHSYRFLIRDRDRKSGSDLDRSVKHLGLKVLKTPVRTPVADAVCERTIGTFRQECLDYLIPITGNHLCSILQKWVIHFNAGRPHSSLGPGIPDPPENLPVPLQEHRHRISPRQRVTCRSILGGLHHEYALQRAA